MSQQPPAFTNQKVVPRWRKTPPALFPPVLGLFGLTVGWLRTPDAFGAPAAIGQILAGAMVLFYAFTAGHYLAKVAARPGVMAEDLTTLPGRAGLAALTMSGMLLATVLVPFAPVIARVVLVLAILGHTVVMTMVAMALASAPAEARKVTPVLHLTFVGLIVSAMPALALGWSAYAGVIFWATLVAAVVIWLLSAAQFVRETPPPPLRPLLAIHLAPASLLGTVAFLMGLPGLGFGFALLALALFVALAVSLPWLTQAGFSPFWGAFTFPLAAFSSLMMILGSAGYGGFYRIIGGLALVAATFFIPWVALKVTRMWLKGGLAVKTNAAVA
ncbi:MAG: tellurium resistance protein [Rhodobacterales bacterium]|nr:MAG: tellurium resistance protein [Rhodobacterales bacterium]